MFAIGNDELRGRPRVTMGDLIRCRHCNETHALRGSDDGREILLVYRCGGSLYLAAIDGALLPGVGLAAPMGADHE